jgi:hypothetical protein
MIYLASPYQHPDPRVRRRRFEAACQAAAKLMLRGEVVFSPIAHSHNIARYLPPKGLDFWLNHDLPILRICNRLVVLCLSGWESSEGIEREIGEAEAKMYGMPVEYMDP